MSLRSIIRRSCGGDSRRRLMVSLFTGAVLLAALVLSIASLALAASSFSDVPPSHHYFDAINHLASRGVLDGYAEDNTFRPDQFVIRQQFAKMVVLSLEYPVSDADMCPFADVQKSMPGNYVDPDDTNYPDHYVAVCAAYGITKGKTATSFAPYENLTRQQLISMVARAANIPEPPSDFVPDFLPGQFYPEEHYTNARRAAYAGLLDGLSGVGPGYDFMAPATRGECAQLLHNLIVYLTPTTTTTASSTTTTGGSPTTSVPC